MKIENGQSLIEVVFAIGIILLVLSGVVGLILTSLGSRTKGYDRQKAMELGQVVMEEIISAKTTKANEFWNFSSPYWIANNGTTQTNGMYSGFNYVIIPSQYSLNGCSALKLECMNVTVNVGWSGSTLNTESYNRFFSNK